MDITIVWAAIIAFALAMYVVLDGFDLGIGILFPLFPDDDERSRLMSSVAPVWDGNETWMVLGGASLYAVFPMVYSVVASALYIPLLFMAICLIFRGVAFELRGKARRTRHLWDLAFIGGSAGATFFQGVVIGSWLSGIPVVIAIDGWVENLDGGNWKTITLSNTYLFSKKTSVYQQVTFQHASGANALASLTGAGVASGRSTTGVSVGIQRLF